MKIKKPTPIKKKIKVVFGEAVVINDKPITILRGPKPAQRKDIEEKKLIPISKIAPNKKFRKSKKKRDTEISKLIKKIEGLDKKSEKIAQKKIKEPKGKKGGRPKLSEEEKKIKVEKKQLEKELKKAEKEAKKEVISKNIKEKITRKKQQQIFEEELPTNTENPPLPKPRKSYTKTDRQIKKETFKKLKDNVSKSKKEKLSYFENLPTMVAPPLKGQRGRPKKDTTTSTFNKYQKVSRYIDDTNAIMDGAVRYYRETGFLNSGIGELTTEDIDVIDTWKIMSNDARQSVRKILGEDSDFINRLDFYITGKIKPISAKIIPNNFEEEFGDKEDDEDDENIEGSGIDIEALSNEAREQIILLMQRLEQIQMMSKKGKTEEIINEYDAVKKQLEDKIKDKWNFDINGEYIYGTGCYYCVKDIFELDEDNEYISGYGFRKFLKRLKKKVFGLRPSIKTPPKVNEAIGEYGNEIITSLKLIRTPISSILQSVANVLSMNQLNKDLKEKGHDAFFHLGIIINDKYVLEKVEVISIKKDNKPIKRNSETLMIEKEDIPANTTIQQLLENTKKYMGDLKYTGYSYLTNNCQDFIVAVLKANEIDKTKYFDFVKQDTTDLLESTPGISQKIIEGITNIGAYANKLIEGEGAKKKNFKTKIKGGKCKKK